MQTDITPIDITPDDITPPDINPGKGLARESRRDIVGWGVDAREDRPGVPEELHPPRPIGHGRPGRPVQQTEGKPSVPSKYRRVTEVYGTAIPARGLSGAIRRYAYTIPDYHASRWALLLLADRVDVIEHNPLRLLVVGSLVAAGLAAALRPEAPRSRWARLFG